MTLAGGGVGRFKKILGRAIHFLFDELDLVSIADFVALFVSHIKHIDHLVGVCRNSGVRHVQPQAMELLSEFIQQTGFVVGEHVDDCGGAHCFVVNFDPNFRTGQF